MRAPRTRFEPLSIPSTRVYSVSSRYEKRHRLVILESAKKLHVQPRLFLCNHPNTHKFLTHTTPKCRETTSKRCIPSILAQPKYCIYRQYTGAACRSHHVSPSLWQIQQKHRRISKQTKIGSHSFQLQRVAEMECATLISQPWYDRPFRYEHGSHQVSHAMCDKPSIAVVVPPSAFHPVPHSVARGAHI
jgi:hypothetical protein